MALFVVILLVTVVIGGRVEGILRPVVTGVSIDRIQVAGETSARIWGTFRILRPDCDFRGLQWFLVGTNRETLVALEFEEGSKVRDGGLNEFGPWRVQLTPDQLKQISRASVFHQCYAFGVARPWLTETRFYP